MARHLYTKVDVEDKLESSVSAGEKMEENCDLPKAERLDFYHCSQSVWRNHSFYHVLSGCVIVVLGLLWGRAVQISDEKCLLHLRAESVANEALRGTSMRDVTFDGSLWFDSPFKGPPTAETNQAWESIMEYGMFATTEEAIREQGRNTTVSSRFPGDIGGGGYMAVAMGSHQLHCLRYIWRDHHREYFPDMQTKIKDIPELYERHYEHCVDIIRQSLMCNFDTSLVTFAWVLKHHNPVPDANSPHKCVDWDRVQAWLKDKAVPMPDGFVFRQPQNAVSLDWNP